MSVRYALDVDSPFAGELLEAFVATAERHGHSIFGFIEGDTLQLIASGEISQTDIMEALLSRMVVQAQPECATHASPEVAVARSLFFRETDP